jgi:Rrf2 family protein
MQITRQAEYAVRTVYYLAKQEPGTSVPTARIAKDQDIPTPFLAKIVLQLSAVGILHTSRGARGGVRLAKAPSEISLLEIVEIVDGPIEINDCVLDEACCQRSETCPVRTTWSEARAELVKHLAQATFGQMIARNNLPLDPEI